MPQPFEYRHRVRYRECDPMGRAYHTHCLDWFEAARTEALRDLGIAYRELEEDGLIMPVVDVSVRYHRAVRYDDEIVVRTWFEDLPPRTRVGIAYEVHDGRGTAPAVTGRVTLCFVDARRNRPITAPDRIVKAFAGIEPALRTTSP